MLMVNYWRSDYCQRPLYYKLQVCNALLKTAEKEALASAFAIWKWNFRKGISETWESEYDFHAFSRKQNPTLKIIVWVSFIKLMHKHSACYSVFHLFSLYLHHQCSLSCPKLNYSFMVLMHHMMLTKPFLIVASLILFLAFFFPKYVLCVLPGTMDAMDMIQLPSSSAHLLWGIISCFLTQSLPASPPFHIFPPAPVQLLFLPPHEECPIPFSMAAFHCAPHYSPILLTSFLRRTT